MHNVSSMADYRHRLRQGWSTLLPHITLTESVESQVLHFITLLQQWSQAINLTAVKHVDEILSKHIFDSLSIAHLLEGDSIADIGSGAGLPGIPLAIAFPQKQFTLVESRQKKAAFMRQVCQVANLTNVIIENRRVERYTPSTLFTTIVSRAFASIEDFLTVTQHLGDNDSLFIAMKGKVPSDEIQQLPVGFRVKSYHNLQVPNLPDQRCAVCFNKVV